MKISNIDNTIRERLQNRTLQPSDSAWDRLAVQLDEQPKKAKKTWVFYSSIAAGFLLLASLSVNFILSNDSAIKPNQEVVIQPIDSSNLNNTIDTKIDKNKPKTMLVQQTDIKNTAPKGTYKKEVQKEEKKPKHKVVEQPKEPAVNLDSKVSLVVETEQQKIESVPVTANLTGSFSQPNVRTDMKQATTNLATQLVKMQKDKLVNQGTSALSNLLGGDKATNATDTNTATDTTKTTPIPKEQVKDGVKNAVKNLFGKKKKEE